MFELLDDIYNLHVLKKSNGFLENPLVEPKENIGMEIEVHTAQCRYLRKNQIM